MRLLLHPRVRRTLGQFMAQEGSAATAARALNADLRAVHRDVQALLQAGLLRETRREARAGRDIRHYRASADAYFVPREHTPDADFAERFERQFGPVDRLLARALGRSFEDAVHEHAHGRRWGLRVFRDGQDLQIDESYDTAELRGVLTGWQGPPVDAFTGLSAGPLTPEQVRQVQSELVTLALRLKGMFDENAASGQGAPHAVRLTLAPLRPDDLNDLRP